MKHGEKKKKWMLWGDGLYYGGSGKEVYHIINAGDVEIYMDKDGEIVEILVKNAHKYLEPDEIEEIAIVYKPEDIEKQLEELRKKKTKNKIPKL